MLKGNVIISSLNEPDDRYSHLINEYGTFFSHVINKKRVNTIVHVGIASCVHTVYYFYCKQIERLK